MRWEIHWEKCWIRKHTPLKTYSESRWLLPFRTGGLLKGSSSALRCPHKMVGFLQWIHVAAQGRSGLTFQSKINMKVPSHWLFQSCIKNISVRRRGKITQGRLQGNRCALKDSKRGERTTASAFGKRGRAFNQAGNGTTWGQSYSTLSGPVFLLPSLYLPCGYTENFLLQSCQFASLMSI